jgi:preprotein translocase subunit SecE
MAAPMNRAQKRMLQRQGALDAEGQPARAQPQQRRPQPGPRPEAKEGRTGPRQFLKEVRQELRKVAWPTKSETINYSIICFLAVAVMMAFIAGVDYVSSEFVLKLFDD